MSQMINACIQMFSSGLCDISKFSVLVVLCVLEKMFET